jgi:transcriptional regulator with XRE-family HTH domain
MWGQEHAMASAHPLTFGQLLRQHRTAAGLTQEALGERAGLSARGISDMERGLRRAPYQDTVNRLAQALQLADNERRQFEAAARRQSAPTLRNMPGFLTNTLACMSEMSGHPTGGVLGALPTGLLAGREAELGAIAVTLDAVASGQGRLLTLAGDPGVGKTRLAQEITLLAHAQGFHVVIGRCYEPEQSVAYYPFLEALASAAGVGGGSRRRDILSSLSALARSCPSPA